MAVLVGRQKDRPVSVAFTELSKLLSQDQASADLIRLLVTELEVGYDTASNDLRDAAQLEADATTKMIGIRQILSDPRLSALGIISHLALPPDDEK